MRVGKIFLSLARYVVSRSTFEMSPDVSETASDRSPEIISHSASKLNRAQQIRINTGNGLHKGVIFLPDEIRVGMDLLSRMLPYSHTIFA